MQELLAFLVVAAVVVATAFVVQRRIGGRLGQLLFLGLCLRIVGATLRLEVIERAYGGGSDAKVYMLYGKEYAERMADLNFGFFLGDEQSPAMQWWGTQFIRSVAAIVVFIIGDNIRAAFLVFSCFSFLGQVLIVEGFGNAFGREHRAEFARWAWFWPSLWFWPSSVGKEAVLTLGLGLFVWGYVGKHGKPDLRAALAGLSIAVAIRPHIAMVFGFCVAVGELLRQRAQGSQRKFLSAIIVVVTAILTLRAGLSQLGLADADLEGVEEYFEHRAGATEQGGSRIYRVRGVLGIPLAFVNVFLRPFPWEARGIQILSSAEIWTFWLVLLINRRALWANLRSWRQNRFLVLSAPLAGALALLYGLAFANMGIIARQRITVIPFMLALLAVSRLPVREVPAPAPVAPLGIHRRGGNGHQRAGP